MKTTDNPETLEALKQSIKHWEDIVSGISIDVGPYACALCGKFNTCFNRVTAPYGERCNGCPVKEKTGKDFCLDTPYPDVEDLDPSNDRFQELAQKELDFLKSLLPVPTITEETPTP